MDKSGKKAFPQNESHDYVYGYHAAMEAIENERGNKLFLQEDSKGSKINQLKQIAKTQSLPVKWVPKAKLDLLSDHGVHQGIVLAVSAYQYLDLETLLAQTKQKTQMPFFLILDSLEDPHNVGAILRTADATGVDGVVLPKHRAVGMTSVVSKAATGALEHIPVARVTNLTQAVKKLKAAGFWIFGTEMQGTDYRNWQVDGAIGLIIGNEGRGISEGLRKEVDESLTIPMIGHVQSLNASVAAGVMMYEVLRKRHPLK